MNYDKIYMNGAWVPSSGSDLIEVENPANEEIIGSVPASNEEDINEAVKSAKEAFSTWKESSIEERICYVEKILEEMRKVEDEMAQIISMELGCPLKFAKDAHVVPYLKDMKNFLSIAKDYKFEEDHGRYIVRKEPIGVIGALTPWNYPLGQILLKLTPALLAGNTLVLKPSKQTPLIAYKLTEAIHRAGLPKGVFNLVPGRGSEVGNILSKHEDVDMVSFTGSTDGGREVSKLAVDGIKKIALELGGKSPSVILKGADYNLAVKRTLSSIFMNVGQSCSAFSRLLVPREDKEKIEKMIVEKAKDFVFGDPSDPATMVGALASAKQFEKVKYYINKGLEEGAKLLIGEVPKKTKGYYVGPTVFTDVDNSMEIAQNEIFGPVLCLIAYDTVEEAIEIANDTVYGLSSAVFGPEKEAHEFANKIRAGEVSVNKGSSLLKAPFGGYKHSGVGREGGQFGFEEFLEIKAIFVYSPSS
ncbi:MAG: aldehyde dehydrogenase family protein [Tissierellia bacterium]|nr:aldehyde dehydrogenase family protein [Tissierellia bacterium]